MAKARAIVKLRKAVKNIRKITKTMQMIATAKYQKSLRRAVGTKPFTNKVRELAVDLASHIGTVNHPLMRVPATENASNREVVMVFTSNRGLAGAYNGTIFRAAALLIKQREAAGKTIELHVAGKKGIAYFNYQKRPIAHRVEIADMPSFEVVSQSLDTILHDFGSGRIDAFWVVFTNFISTSQQRAESLRVLPIAGLKQISDYIGRETREGEAQLEKGSLDETHSGKGIVADSAESHEKLIYEFSPSGQELLNELLPLSVKTMIYQAMLDSITSENVARMVSMKSATDNADKMIKSLTMQYNRARQTQITTELSEIMGGVEAMQGE